MICNIPLQVEECCERGGRLDRPSFFKLDGGRLGLFKGELPIKSEPSYIPLWVVWKL